jgi:hypothetical protein
LAHYTLYMQNYGGPDTGVTKPENRAEGQVSARFRHQLHNRRY